MIPSLSFRRHDKSKLIIGVGVSLVLFNCALLLLPPSPQQLPLPQTEFPIILIGSLFFRDRFQEDLLGQWPSTCPFNCVVLENEWASSPDAVKYASAILFHFFQTDLIPALRSLRQLRQRERNLANKLPKNVDQIWALLALESYATIKDEWHVDYKRLNGLFNWTVSFRRDSDVFAPYQGVDGFKPVGKVFPEKHRRMKVFQPFRRENFAKKKRHIAALISNCRDNYGRLDFLKELASYGLSVDIYGDCSPDGLTCSGRMSRSCYSTLEEQYYFYASFENSICRDYVTEKFYNILDYDLIPLVVNGANLTQLVAAPAHSYIDAMAFDSAARLAAYLQRVAGDIDEYASYFEWKNRFQLVYDDTLHPLCGICKKIYETRRQERQPGLDRLKEWFQQDSKCKSSLYSK